MDATIFSGLVSLSHRVTVYVPGTNGVNAAADNSSHVQRVAVALSDWFGGATASPVLGYWLSPSAGLVSEHTTMIFAFCDEVALQSHADDLIKLCADLRDTLQQEAVALEVDGKMLFV